MNARILHTVFSHMLAVAVLLCWTGQLHAAGPQHTPSPVITGISFDWSTHVRRADGSDNWPITWADDDHQYTSWGDGGGFRGNNSGGRVSLGVARIEGNQDSYVSVNVWGGYNPENTATFQGKSYGLLSVAGTLYMWVMVEGSYFSKSELYYSTNHGASWTSAGWRFENPEGVFSVSTFLNFGKDYQGARDNYVYIYAPGPAGNFSSTTNIDLARVPKDQLTNRSAYEFFTGLDGNGQPTWSADIQKRQPVFTDTGKVHWTVGVSYNPGLDRYFIFNNSRPNTSQNEGSPTDLEIFDAPTPWGPWTLAMSFPDWNQIGYTFSYYMAPKWISSDGKDFTLVFSGTGVNDSWNTVRGSISVKTTTATIPSAPTGVTVTKQ